MNISGFLWNGEKQHHPLKKYIIQTKVKIQKTFLFFIFAGGSEREHMGQSPP